MEMLVYWCPAVKIALFPKGSDDVHKPACISSNCYRRRRVEGRQGIGHQLPRQHWHAVTQVSVVERERGCDWVRVCVCRGGEGRCVGSKDGDNSYEMTPHIQSKPVDTVNISAQQLLLIWLACPLSHELKCRTNCISSTRKQAPWYLCISVVQTQGHKECGAIKI